MAPMIEVIKRKSFRWTPKAQLAFKDIKAKLTQAPVALHCFDKVFEVEYDASGVDVGGVLIRKASLWPSLVKSYVI